MSAQMRNLVAAVAVALSSLLSNGAYAQIKTQEEFQAAFIDAEAVRQEAEQTDDPDFAKQKYNEAIPKYDELIAANRDYPPSHFGRAECLRAIEEYDSAIVSYRDAIQNNERYAQAHNGQGICYREQNDIQLALHAFRLAAEFDRTDPEIAANLGDLLVNVFQGQSEAMEAMPHLDRAIEKNPEDAKSYRNRGWAHILLRESEDGIADLTKAVELDPSDYETYQKLADAYGADDEYQSSIDALSKAIEQYEPEDSGDPDTYIKGYLQRAATRMSLAKEEDATPEQIRELYRAVIADADTVLSEVPETGIALYLRGTALRMQGLFAEAITAFTDAIQLVPPGRESNYTGEAYLLRGICWFYQGNNKLARGDFKDAAAKSLEDPRPYLWIGLTQAKEDKYRKAIESYGEAAARNPAFSLAHVNRGLAYMQLKDYDKAVDNFSEAIRAEPTEPRHFYKCGRAYELLDEPQKALDFFNLALLRDGDYADANQGAARALKALGRPSLGNQYQNRVSP